MMLQKPKPKLIIEKQIPSVEKQKIIPQIEPQPLIETQPPISKIETQPPVSKIEIPQQEIKIQINAIKINDELFRNEDPPPCKVVYKQDNNNSVTKDIVIIAENDVCTICKRPSSEDNPKTIFKCKHWSCFKCINQKTPVCPICEKHSYIKLPLNTGTSKTYESFINNALGQQGLIKSVKTELSLEQKIYLKLKSVKELDKGYDLSGDTFGLTIDSLSKKGFTLPMIYHCLNVKTRISLYSLGLTNMNLYDKRFTEDTEILKKYGIDRNFINDRASIEGYPVIYLVQLDAERETTPAEAMFRGGYNLIDFIDLGWYSGAFVEDRVPPNIYYSLIKRAIDKGMKVEKVYELFKIDQKHLSFYGLQDLKERIKGVSKIQKPISQKQSPISQKQSPISLKQIQSPQTKTSMLISNSLRLKDSIEKKKSFFKKQ